MKVNLKRISQAQLKEELHTGSLEATFEFNRAFEAANKRLAADPAFQRDGLLTREERGRRAIDEMAKEVVEWKRKVHGVEMTFEAAREYVIKLATRSDMRRSVHGK